MGSDARDRQPVIDDTTPSPPSLEPPEGGRESTQRVEASIVKGQLKVAYAPSHGTSTVFEIWCDEPPKLGGEDRHPSPLNYVTAGVAF